MNADELASLPTHTKVRMRDCPSVFSLIWKDHLSRWIAVEHYDGKSIRTRTLRSRPEIYTVVS